MSTAPSATKPLLVNDQASADIIGISRATFWRLVSTGILPPPIKLGRASKWKRHTLEAFVDGLEPGDAVEVRS